MIGTDNPLLFSPIGYIDQAILAITAFEKNTGAKPASITMSQIALDLLVLEQLKTGRSDIALAAVGGIRVFDIPVTVQKAELGGMVLG